MHCMDDDNKKACDRRMNGSYHNKVINKDKKKKMTLDKIFEKMPKNAHKMAGGVIMSGKTHNKNSKVLGKLKKKKNKKK